MNKSTAVSFVRSNPVIGAQSLGVLTRSDDDSSVEFQPQAVTGLVTLGQHRQATQTTVSVRLARDGTASQSRPTSTDTMPDAIRANWYELAISRLSVDAFARLNFLATKQAGWRGPGSMALKGDSVSKFLRFWSAVRADAAEPELMLTPMGTLQAEWFKNHKQFLEIEFSQSDESSNFGLIDRQTRLEGKARPSELIQLLKGYRDGIALTWTPA